MKVLVVGNGAREHAIIRALSLSPQRGELYAFMTCVNPGIAGICKEFEIGDILDGRAVAQYAKKTSVDVAVIGPEAPLGAGVADELERVGIPCAGPKMEAARIETDKSFARQLMRDHRIDGTPRFGVFDDADEATSYIDECGFELAIKPAGLTAGKGVMIMGEHLDAEGAKEYVKRILSDGMGHIPRVVLEERLVGEEFTLQAFCDGKNVLGTPMVQDHKRAYEGDKGPNTGGMGSYCDFKNVLPFLCEKDYDDGLSIMEATVRAIRSETGQSYRGFLYGQFMATSDGVKVIEYNARLGDPEAMNVLSILESDMKEICQGMAGEGLTKDAVFSKKATVCKYLVPRGYPEKPLKDLRITVDEKAIEKEGGIPYYASVRLDAGQILTSSSRAVAVLGVADDISSAEAIAQRCTGHVGGDLIHRADIGSKRLLDSRFERMKALRG